MYTWSVCAEVAMIARPKIALRAMRIRWACWMSFERGLGGEGSGVNGWKGEEDLLVIVVVKGCLGEREGVGEGDVPVILCFWEG